MKNIFATLFVVKKYPIPIFNPDHHKHCEGCNGSGLDIWGSCFDCDGKGFKDKSYKEKYYL